MQPKTALITGITGQDGSLLAKHLISKNYQVLATARSGFSDKNLVKLSILDDEQLSIIEYQDYSEFEAIIKDYQPSEIYHLAAMSHVGESHKNPKKVFSVNTDWTLVILDAIATHSANSRLFFASTCEIFDKSKGSLLNEESEKKPLNPYAISKLAAHNLVEYYREVKGIYACNCILFNHESKLRPDTFVTQKIFKNVARIVKNGGAPLELGNIYVKKDWSFAADFIPVFEKMLSLDSAEDFVLASGKLHSVKELVETAFTSFDYSISWSGEAEDTMAHNDKGECVVKINPEFYRPLDFGDIYGDITKAKKQLKWQGSRPFKEWVKELTMEQYRILS